MRDIATTLPAARRAQLQHVAGERGELLHAELDDARARSCATRPAPRRARPRECTSDRPQRSARRRTSARWCDRSARRLASYGFERDDVVVELLREVAEHVQIGARRNAGVGDAMDAIEHEAAGAFQELAAAARGA